MPRICYNYSRVWLWCQTYFFVNVPFVTLLARKTNAKKKITTNTFFKGLSPRRNEGVNNFAWKKTKMSMNPPPLSLSLSLSNQMESQEIQIFINGQLARATMIVSAPFVLFSWFKKWSIYDRKVHWTFCQFVFCFKILSRLTKSGKNPELNWKIEIWSD